MSSATRPSRPSMPAWARATVDRLLLGSPTPLDLLWADPGRVLTAAGMGPDPWQTGLILSSADRILMLCARQVGKSTLAAALALADGRRYALEGSANLRTNHNVEQFALSRGPQPFAWYDAWLCAMMQKYEVDESGSPAAG